MKKHSCAVIGATGQVGSKVALNLLEDGYEVRVIGRDFEKMQSFIDKKAQAYIGSVEDGEFLCEAFQDAKAILSMIPPNNAASDFPKYQKQVSEAIIYAIAKTNSQYVVNISSVGAGSATRKGPITGLHFHEERLNNLESVNVVHLRTGYFMENLLFYANSIKQKHVCETPLAPKVPIHMVSVKDVAAAATFFIQSLSFKQKSSIELSAERGITMLEVIDAIRREMQMPNLKYIQSTYEKAHKMMVEGGMSASMADSMIEMYIACNEGRIDRTNFGTPYPTVEVTVEMFAQFFAKICKN